MNVESLNLLVSRYLNASNISLEPVGLAVLNNLRIQNTYKGFNIRVVLE